MNRVRCLPTPESPNGPCFMFRLRSGEHRLRTHRSAILVRYQSRTDLRVCNDDNADWVEPAFAEIYRVLKLHSYCVNFYGWNRVDLFFAAWKKAGFRAVGHLVFPKQYASGGRLLRYSHKAVDYKKMPDWCPSEICLVSNRHPFFHLRRPGGKRCMPSSSMHSSSVSKAWRIDLRSAPATRRRDRFQCRARWPGGLRDSCCSRPARRSRRASERPRIRACAAARS